MAPSGRAPLGRQGKLKWERISKIMALVPPENATSSDGSSSSDEELLLSTTQEDDASSEPRSIPSSMEKYNISDISDEEPGSPTNNCFVKPIENRQISDIETVPLTPIMTQLFHDSFSPHAPLPVINNLSSVLSPQTPSPAPKTRSKRTANLVPKPKTSAKRRKYVAKPLNFNWKLAQFRHRAEIEAALLSIPFDTVTKSPCEHFFAFFSEDIIQMITNESNLYSVQKSNTSKCLNITTDDVRDFIAISLLMGVVSMPAYRDYWSNELRYPPVADVMPLKKYENIRRNLHFVNNHDVTDDRYYKIRPLMEKVRQNCLQVEEEGRYSIDEMMVPYKGTRASNRRQYLPKKPKKWGFKMFVRAGVSGIVYDFLPYAGEDTFRYVQFTDYEGCLGLGGKVVLALCKTITRTPSIVYFDNFFTSLELIHYLRHELGIFSLGTVRNNRLRGCQDKFPTEKQLSKMTRGSSKQVVCNNNKLAVVKWNDNKVVTLASSFVDSHPVESIRRYSKEAKAKVNVDCPQIVKEYNMNMGGVDLADMFVALYRTNMKTKRWYMALFSQILDICVNNAWLIYRRSLHTDKKRISLKKFRIQIANELLQKDRANDSNLQDNNKPRSTIKTPAAPRPTDGVRYDNVGHLPVFSATKGRCKYCKGGFTMTQCIKCQLRLCYTPKKNCFYNFHVLN